MRGAGGSRPHLADKGPTEVVCLGVISIHAGKHTQAFSPADAIRREDTMPVGGRVLEAGDFEKIARRHRRTQCCPSFHHCNPHPLLLWHYINIKGDVGPPGPGPGRVQGWVQGSKGSRQVQENQVIEVNFEKLVIIHNEEISGSSFGSSYPVG